MLARFFTLALLTISSAGAQSLGNAGTIEGTVTDPSGAAIPEATVNLHNKLTNYSQTLTAGGDGAFRITNIPPNTYHLEVSAPGFTMFSQDVTISNSLPIHIKAHLLVASSTTTVNVEAASEALETDPSAHADVDRNQMMKLPLSDPALA